MALSQIDAPAQKVIVAAINQGIDPMRAINTLKCESNFKHEGVYGDQGKAYGISQFWEGTFNRFKEEAGAPELDYRNIDDQVALFSWAIATGHEKSWTCWKRVKEI